MRGSSPRVTPHNITSANTIKLRHPPVELQETPRGSLEEDVMVLPEILPLALQVQRVVVRLAFHIKAL
jgi:hypothetical protein